MMNTSTLKKLSLVFGILCACGLVACLVAAVDLPYTTTYNTVWGTVRSTTPGSFNYLFLTPVILLSMGTYCGFALFASLKCPHCSSKQGKEEKKEEEKKETFDTAEDPNV